METDRSPYKLKVHKQTLLQTTKGLGPPSRPTSAEESIPSTFYLGFIDIIWWSNHFELHEDGADVVNFFLQTLTGTTWVYKKLADAIPRAGKHVLWNPLATVPVECGREDIPTHSRIEENEEWRVPAFSEVLHGVLEK